jgi:hypothetical protein
MLVMVLSQEKNLLILIRVSEIITGYGNRLIHKQMEKIGFERYGLSNSIWLYRFDIYQT